MADCRLESHVRVVQRLTFLELATYEAPADAGRLARSLSDSALLHGRAEGFGAPAAPVEPCVCPGKDTACEEEPELASTSVGDEAEVADTCSICSWATDQDQELCSAYIGFYHARPAHDEGLAIAQAPQVHTLQSLRPGQGDGNSSCSGPAEDPSWRPRRQRVRKFPKAGRREPSRQPEASKAGGAAIDALPTTLIFRHVPGEWTVQDVADLLDTGGFRSAYDFIHVPVKFHDMRNVGYALVNLRDHEAADAARRWLGAKILVANWNATSQGLAALVGKYRNSAVMHESVPEQHRPGLFSAGARVPFPAPTEPIRAPRVRINKRTA